MEKLNFEIQIFCEEPRELNDKRKKIIEYLEKNNIEFDNSRIYKWSEFIPVRIDRLTWKKMKKDLNLKIDTVYCSQKEIES